MILSILVVCSMGKVDYYSLKKVIARLTYDFLPFPAITKCHG